MSLIGEQIKTLRKIENTIENQRYETEYLLSVIKQAADTIETLSAKLATANMERSERYYGLHKVIEELELNADDANDRTLTDNTEDMFYYDGKEDGIRFAIELIKPLIDEDTANVTEKAD